MLNKFKKCKFEKDKELFKLVNLVDNKDFLDNKNAPIRIDYVEKREIDRSRLYSFDGPFQVIHTDVGNLEFLRKNATFSQHVLLIVDLYSLKVYTYSMKSRKQILQKMKIFYDQVRSKRKGKRMLLQVDNEFQQVKIKELNDANNVEMFTSSIKGGKAFAAEQKIRELKTRISKLKTQKLKISPTKIIKNSTLDMSLMKSVKYGLSPEEIERTSLVSEKFNIHRLQKTKKLHDRLDRYDVRKYSTKRMKLREELFVDKKSLFLLKELKRKLPQASSINNPFNI